MPVIVNHTHILINERADLTVAGDVIVERTMIDTPSFGHTVVDPDWTATDPAGHFHAGAISIMSSERRRELELITLDRRLEDTGEDEDGDPITRPWYACKICGAEVEPRWTSVSGRHDQTPGPIEWKVYLVAFGDSADAMASYNHHKISFRAPFPASGVEHFGFGRVITHRTSFGMSPPIRWEGVIVPDGPLGSRTIKKVPQQAASAE